MLSPPHLCDIEIVTLYTADCTILTKSKYCRDTSFIEVIEKGGLVSLCCSFTTLPFSSFVVDKCYLSIYLSIYLLGIEHCFSCVMKNMLSMISK